MWQYNWGFGLFPFLWPIVWFFIIVVIFSHLFRNERHKGSDSKSVEDILSERFAKGEIDGEEYKKRLDVIRKQTK